MSDEAVKFAVVVATATFDEDEEVSGGGVTAGETMSSLVELMFCDATDGASDGCVSDDSERGIFSSVLGIMSGQVVLQ